MTHDRDKRPELEDLQSALGQSQSALASFLDRSHPADLAEWFEELEEDEARTAFAALDEEKRSELLQFAEDDVIELLVGPLEAGEIVRLVELMPADDVVDVLAHVDDAKTEEVLRRVDFERARGLRELSAYDEDTAGGLMTTEFVAVPTGTRIGDAIKKIKREEGPAGDEEVGVWIVDDHNRPVGFVSDRELLTNNIHTPIEEVMETDLVTAGVDDDQEDVAHTIVKYDLRAIPVVDASGVLEGVVAADDVAPVLEEEAEEDILRLVGTSPEEQTRMPVMRRVRHRLPMQALTVVGGLVTAFLLDRALPGDGGESAGTILIYLPIIIGLAGNVGIQSSTILVRAFATGEVDRDNELAALRSEVLTGLVIGLLCGATTMVAASYLESLSTPDFRFGGAVGFAIAIAVSWAALLGSIVPIACDRMGFDPAIVAGPFLITLSDISGSAIFVGVAHVLLEMGGPASGV